MATPVRWVPRIYRGGSDTRILGRGVGGKRHFREDQGPIRGEGTLVTSGGAEGQLVGWENAPLRPGSATLLAYSQEYRDTWALQDRLSQMLLYTGAVLPAQYFVEPRGVALNLKGNMDYDQYPACRFLMQIIQTITTRRLAERFRVEHDEDQWNRASFIWALLLPCLAAK